MSDQSVSLCLIVRDCAEHITDTLKSIAENDNPIATEVVIVDTGSTDKTVDSVVAFAKSHRNIRWDIKGGVPPEWFTKGGICKQCEGYGASTDSSKCTRCSGSGLVEGDGKPLLTRFDLARNLASQLATKNWVGWLDADDTILNKNQIVNRISQKIWRDPPESLDGESLNSILSKVPDSVDAIVSPRYCYGGVFDKNPLLVMPVRIVRNNGSWSWQDRIHESLKKVSSSQSSFLVHPEFIVEHHPKGNWPNRSRDVAVINRVIEEDGPTFKFLCYLISIYIESGHFGLAEKSLDRMSPKNDKEYYIKWLLDASLFNAEGNKLTAISCCESAYKLCPSLPDAPFLLANMNMDLGSCLKAVEWFTIGHRQMSNGFCVLSNFDQSKIIDRISSFL